VRSFTFPGTFEDHDEAETLIWHIQNRPGWGGHYEIRIRSAALWGPDFDGLEPDDAGAIRHSGLPLNSAGDLTECVLTGDLPCLIDLAGRRRPTTVHFELDLREHSDRPAHNRKNFSSRRSSTAPRTRSPTTGSKKARSASTTHFAQAGLCAA
jgi:hypothetical protein